MASSPKVKELGALLASSDLLRRSVLFTPKIEPEYATFAP
jgi:hypothetical protein